MKGDGLGKELLATQALFQPGFFKYIQFNRVLSLQQELGMCQARDIHFDGKLNSRVS